MIFVSFSQPCTRVDVLPDVWVEDVIDMSVEVLVVGARAGALIDVLFGIKLNVVVAVLIGALVSATVAVVPDNSAGMLDGLNVDTFIIPASPEEEYLLFRWTASSCVSMTALDAACALQSCNPSYQV